MSIHLSEEDNIVLRLGQEGHEVTIRLYPLNSLRPPLSAPDYPCAISQPSLEAPFTFCAVVPPAHEFRVSWSDSASRSISTPFPNPDLLELGTHLAAETFAYCVWNMLPWWPTFKRVPYRMSTVVLYCADRPASREKSWLIAQHYATDKGPGPILTPAPPTRPCAPSEYYGMGSSLALTMQDENRLMTAERTTNDVDEQVVYKQRCIVDLHDPVIAPFSDVHMPILGLDFNHVGWIEQIEIHRRLRRYKRRVAMLATFPDPGFGSPQLSLGTARDDERGSLKANIRTLDIPEHVLNDACHFIVDSACATVSITTRGNELYNYRFA